MQFTPAQVAAAVKAHGTKFFTVEAGELVPVEPKAGEWFCEFDEVIPEDERPAFIRDEALVEYVELAELQFTDGEKIRRHMVAPEHADDCREARGVMLIRQG